MKQFYDKLLLIVALLAFGGSVAFYFMGKDDAAPGGGSSASLNGSAFSPLATPEVVDSGSTEWPEPMWVGENKQRLYRVFTPPKIYWDAQKQELTWVAPPDPDAPVEIPVFGVELVALERELFRIQLEADFGSRTGSSDDAIIQLYNHEKHEKILGSPGDEFPEDEFKIVSFRVERVILEEEGSTVIYKNPIVVIEDMRAGEEITLEGAERLYVPGKFNIVMRTEGEGTPETFTWTEIGQTYSSANGDVFTLLEFNFDNQTATVEKMPASTEEVPEPEAEVEVLTPVEETQTAPTETEETEEIIQTESEQGDTFDANFFNF